MRWRPELGCPHRRRTASEWGASLLGKGSSEPCATAARIAGHLHTMVRGSVRFFLLLPTSDQHVPPTMMGQPEQGWK